MPVKICYTSYSVALLHRKQGEVAILEWFATNSTWILITSSLVLTHPLFVEDWVRDSIASLSLGGA
jgi:hypothetical protein